MRVGLLSLQCFISFLQTISTAPVVQRRDTPFESVRTRLSRDHSKHSGDEPDKYFHEAIFASHYDGRFADRELLYDERRIRLRALVQTYLSTMYDIGIETFIMHGTLLGFVSRIRPLPGISYDIGVRYEQPGLTQN